ncbi:YoaH family protein [Xenorhabdus sp. DI]|uniref:YoaH family protein n=1 Tax=Xenorhabdus TaxID=626 RepID=UPI0019AF9EE2|nr:MULTISPECIES: YoaH family protein [unclassified Xenorhabdus]MBD2785446.1 YoaH family protein [Xenorhabdus sp. 3]MBD2788867.1 YoaH family protein [Xenorhabdus sp. DI]MBD2795093.1 YoaH family protein [Xenorhabdus sp. 18]MDC9582530.1 YoaH family protein [Xenorhabdus sp. PR6a]
MFSGMPALSHEEQQAAVEKIHQLISEGMGSGEAIAIVAQELREKHQGKEQIPVLFEDDEN